MSAIKHSMQDEDRTSNDSFAENGKVSGKKASVSAHIECHQGSVYLYDTVIIIQFSCLSLSSSSVCLSVILECLMFIVGLSSNTLKLLLNIA